MSECSWKRERFFLSSFVLFVSEEEERSFESLRAADAQNMLNRKTFFVYTNVNVLINIIRIAICARSQGSKQRITEFKKILRNVGTFQDETLCFLSRQIESFLLPFHLSTNGRSNNNRSFTHTFHDHRNMRSAIEKKKKPSPSFTHAPTPRF